MKFNLVGELDITATVRQMYTAHKTYDNGRDEGMPVGVVCSIRCEEKMYYQGLNR